jgi:lysophospholipase L1-like esterase
VDAYNALLNYGTNFPDGIHPDAGGCKVLAKAVADAVKSPSVKYE